jgi:allophanate hydrolase subunit 1
VISAHTGTPWRVGSADSHRVSRTAGGDERLNVPRQSEPRTRVPAGSVALAGEFSGVYPRESPGGWQLIGRISNNSADTRPLWDVDRDPPALLRPGMWVQFREVRS